MRSYRENTRMPTFQRVDIRPRRDLASVESVFSAGPWMLSLKAELPKVDDKGDTGEYTCPWEARPDMPMGRAWAEDLGPMVRPRRA
jgi:hypothetical protein